MDETIAINEDNKLSCSNDAEVDDTFNPRCILVTGIPLKSRGFGLKRLLRSIIQKTFSDFVADLQNDEKPPPISQKQHFIIRTNIHGHVRDGCCHVVFATASEANDFLKNCCGPVQFEGSTLTFSYGASSLRDHFFPSLPYEVRRKIMLDSVSTYSVTGEVASMRMGTCLTLGILPYVKKNNNEKIHVIDATAGAGGNTIGLVRAAIKAGYKTVQATVAEIDQQRFENLVTNLKLALPYFVENTTALTTTNQPTSVFMNQHSSEVSVDINCVQKCGFETMCASQNADVIFFDPPWGGPNYAELDEIQMIVNEKGNASVTLTLIEIILRLIKKSVAPIIAVKLPSTYNVTHLADAITQNTYSIERPNERHFPFKFHFDATMLMVVIVRNPMIDMKAHENLTSLSGNEVLDTIVLGINTWHGKGDEKTGQYDEVYTGNGVCRPEFFDFEKRRWIQLKKWIPTSNRISN